MNSPDGHVRLVCVWSKALDCVRTGKLMFQSFHAAMKGGVLLRLRCNYRFPLEIAICHRLFWFIIVLSYLHGQYAGGIPSYRANCSSYSHHKEWHSGYTKFVPWIPSKHQS